jgi:hypothetical protein
MLLCAVLPPGVTLCNCRGAHDSAVAEWFVGAILAMQRRPLEHLPASATPRRCRPTTLSGPPRTSRLRSGLPLENVTHG